MHSINPPKTQPTFVFEIAEDAELVLAKIRSVVDQHGAEMNVVSAGSVMDFRVDAEEQRFWSPHLSVQVSKTETGTEVFGRFSPRPEIWTMFMAFYAVVSFIVFAASILGFVQWTLGSWPWGLVVVPIGVILIGGLHSASLVGQSLSAHQMETLRERLDQVLASAGTSQRV